MQQGQYSDEETGLYVEEAAADQALSGRALRSRSLSAQLHKLEQIAAAFVTGSDSLLQELVDAALELCGADSAGISIEKPDRTDESFYQSVATAGEYSAFLHAELPRYPSACGVCLERGRPQHFRVGKRFFDIMGITAPLVTDGILLPWVSDDTRGTIFVMAHGRENAFDAEDAKVVQVFANFAAMAIREGKRQKALLKQAELAAAASMANDLAHKINNPLQGLTNLLYLAENGHHGEDAKSLGQEASADLAHLSGLVKKILELSTPQR